MDVVIKSGHIFWAPCYMLCGIIIINIWWDIKLSLKRQLKIDEIDEIQDVKYPDPALSDVWYINKYCIFQTSHKLMKE